MAANRSSSKKESSMKNFRFWIILTIAYCLLPTAYCLLPKASFAHPGRLNSEGCHHVREDWVYKDGKILKAGEYHCHRKFGEIKFDGKELLEDPRDKGMPTKEVKPNEK